MDKKTDLKSIQISGISIGERFRKDYGKTPEWDSFVKDIDENGLISAIAVKLINKDEYELLAGGRRLRACTELEHSHINATIYTGNIDEADMTIIELNENLKRKELSPQEEAEGKLKFLNLMQEKYGKKEGTSRTQKDGVSMRDAAEMIGETVTNFSRDVSLARAFEVMPELKDCKTKTEAYKAAQKNLRKLDEFNAVEKLKARQKKEADSPKQAYANSYKVGDFFEGVKKISESICDLIEIDPPYGIDLHGQKKKQGAIGSMTKDYNEIDTEEYEAFMRKTLKEAYRIAANVSWLILWFGIHPWFEQMFQWATDAGWKGRRMPGIWYKPGAGQCNQPQTYLASNAEYFFYFQKGMPAINRQGRSNVFLYPPINPQNKRHPTERPIELITDIIGTFVSKGSTICTPFAGSGNTILAAANTKGGAFGWDLSETYRNSFLLKVDEQEPGKYHSYKG